LIQALKAETRLPILPVKPQGDKVSRAHAVSPLVESGRVALPDAAPWLNDFMEEVVSFPSAPHDDMVDSFVQALSYLRGSGSDFEGLRSICALQLADDARRRREAYDSGEMIMNARDLEALEDGGENALGMRYTNPVRMGRLRGG